MSAKLAHTIKNKLSKIYAVGILVFIAIFGFVTVFASFVAHLK